MNIKNYFGKASYVIACFYKNKNSMTDFLTNQQKTQ